LTEITLFIDNSNCLTTQLIIIDEICDTQTNKPDFYSNAQNLPFF